MNGFLGSGLWVTAMERLCLALFLVTTKHY